MKTVAIICEYNPFHKGHEYQIKKIREEFGADTAIVSIMSGNFTQRGNFAFIPKNVRAKCAIEGGADLVIELPFPYSSSSAEIFASAGVSIASSLGTVDILSFGSECGDINKLTAAASAFLSEEYMAAFERLNSDKTLGYPERCELAYKEAASVDNFEFTPNNILAIEYIKAIITQGSSLIPHTVKRDGAAYNDGDIKNTENQSAMAIRSLFVKDAPSALLYLPKTTRDAVETAIALGDAPTDENKLSSAVISYFRLNPDGQSRDFYDARDGLYNRLYAASLKANDISSLIKLTETKKFTNARLRRAIWNCYFGVTSSDVKEVPMYTQVLAMNEKGMLVLKNSKKRAKIAVLTKPADCGNFSETALRQKKLSDSADAVFELSKPVPKFGNSAITFTPYIKKM